MRVSWQRFEGWRTAPEKSPVDPDGRVLALVGLIIGMLMLLVMVYAVAVARGWTTSY